MAIYVLESRQIPPHTTTLLGRIGHKRREDQPVLLAVVVVVVLVSAVVPVASVPVPFVIVINTAAISVPVSYIKLLSIVVRFDPSSPLIRRSCPISVMPLIVISDWIPITVYIRVTGTRAPRHNANHTRTRRRTNSNAERDLSLRCRCTGQQDDGEQQRRAGGRPNEILDDIKFPFTTHIAQMAPPTE